MYSPSDAIKPLRERERVDDRDDQVSTNSLENLEIQTAVVVAHPVYLGNWLAVDGHSEGRT